MKISVIMIDGSFRENIFGAEYFAQQNFPESEYEVIWVEFYSKTNNRLPKNEKMKIITLGNSDDTVYHSSYCFNEGIKRAKGEVLIIPDADQIVRPDFIQKVWEKHQFYDKLAVYGYRYDEAEKGGLENFEFEELERKCILKNPINYGGCLTVRKKWLLKINGYEQHEIFQTGFHANGLDVYTRFKNLGLAIQWEPSLKLYHPWHKFTLENAPQYKKQKKIIQWRGKNLKYMSFEGINPTLNSPLSFPDMDLSADKKENLVKRMYKLIKR